MNLPGFTAESSLGPAMGHYGGATISGTSGAGGCADAAVRRTWIVRQG